MSQLNNRVSELMDEINSIKEQESKLRDKYDRCISYKFKYCLLGTLVTLPISLKTKSYTPFFVGALTGTAGDFYDAKVKCTPLRDQLDDLLSRKDKLDDELNQILSQTEPKFDKN